MPDDTPPLDGGRPAEVTRPTVRKGTAMRVTIAFAWLPALLWAGLTATARGEEPAGAPPARKHSNLERLAPDRLAAVHADVERLGRQRADLPPPPGLFDYRCILHAHAEDSDHTGGTLPEMLADAKKAGVHAILLTDHYRARPATSSTAAGGGSRTAFCSSPGRRSTASWRTP